MSRPTAHVLRLASVQWCFTHSRVAGNAAIKRAVLAQGADGIAPSESLRMLLGIFEQVEFDVEQDIRYGADGVESFDILTEDDQCQAWNDVAERWSLDWHTQLVLEI